MVTSPNEYLMPETKKVVASPNAAGFLAPLIPLIPRGDINTLPPYPLSEGFQSADEVLEVARSPAARPAPKPAGSEVGVGQTAPRECGECGRNEEDFPSCRRDHCPVFPGLPLDPADMARQLERAVAAAYGMALTLQGAAVRQETREHMIAVVSLLDAAEKRLAHAAWAFVGDRIQKEAARHG